MFIIRNSIGLYFAGFEFRKPELGIRPGWSSDRPMLIKNDDIEGVKKDILKTYKGELIRICKISEESSETALVQQDRSQQ